MRTFRLANKIPRGVEQVANSSNKTPTSKNVGARGGAIEGKTGSVDADLAALIDAWPTLSKANKAGILEKVRAAEDAG